MSQFPEIYLLVIGFDWSLAFKEAKISKINHTCPCILPCSDDLLKLILQATQAFFYI